MTAPQADALASAEGAKARAEFEVFNEAFQRAAVAAGGIDVHTFLIAGKRVLIEFAGPALVPYLTAALSHLEASFADEPELTLRVWDSKSTGVALPPEAGDLERHIASGMPAAPAPGEVLRTFRRPDRGLSMYRQGFLSGTYWLPAVEHGGFEDRATPFRALFSWGLAELGVQFLHGACVGPAGAGRGVLVVGRGGSGKSSTALVSLAAGMNYVSDDYCAVTLAGSVKAHSIYSSAKITADNLVRFPWVRPLIANPERMEFEKGIVFLNDHRPDQLVSGLEIDAVLAPRVFGNGPTTVAPITGSQALRAIAPSTLFQLSAMRSANLSFLAEVARRLPAFEMRIGQGVDGIPTAINQVLASGVAG